MKKFRYKMDDEVLKTPTNCEVKNVNVTRDIGIVDSCLKIFSETREIVNNSGLKAKTAKEMIDEILNVNPLK